MFDFQKLIVYQKAKIFNLLVDDFLRDIQNLTRTQRDQLERAAFSICLNIAEGTGRFSKKDRRKFYIIARSSALECAAIIDLLTDKKKVSEEMRSKYFKMIDELSRILFAMIRKLEI